jgi:hypothetical protein
MHNLDNRSNLSYKRLFIGLSLLSASCGMVALIELGNLRSSGSYGLASFMAGLFGYTSVEMLKRSAE